MCVMPIDSELIDGRLSESPRYPSHNLHTYGKPMKKMDFKMPLGTVIHLLAVVWISMEPRYDGLYIWMLPFLVLNMIGMLLVMLDKAKLGAILFIIGCVPFVPVGVIGILGAKKSLQASNTLSLSNA